MEHTVAGEVKVLPNQTQKKLRHWDMETNSLTQHTNRYE